MLISGEPINAYKTQGKKDLNSLPIVEQPAPLKLNEK
jgi:hypothetical protein